MTKKPEVKVMYSPVTKDYALVHAKTHQNAFPTKINKFKTKEDAMKFANTKDVTLIEDFEIDDSDFEMTDEELDSLLDEIEDELFTDEDSDDISEALTLAQRIKKGRQMKRLAPKIQRKRKLAMKKKATSGQIEKRSRRAAVKVLKQKIAGKRGKSYSKLAPSAKAAIDKQVKARSKSLGGLAKRLKSKVRAREQKRLSGK